MLFRGKCLKHVRLKQRGEPIVIHERASRFIGAKIIQGLNIIHGRPSVVDCLSKETAWGDGALTTGTRLFDTSLVQPSSLSSVICEAHTDL